MDRHIEASTALPVSLVRARQALDDRPGEVFGCQTPAGGPDRRLPITVTTALANGTSAAQPVELRLGMAIGSGHGGSADWTFAWSPVGPTRHLPAFAGTLSTRQDGEQHQLRLHGRYRMPVGPGRGYGDGALAHRLLRSNLTTFLEDLARRLTADIGRRDDPSPPEVRAVG